jgi:hypothetical protein
METCLMPKKYDSILRSYNFFIITVLFLIGAAAADADDVVIAWDPNAESDLAGYKIYVSEGFPGPPYDLIDILSLDDIDPDNPACRISDLDDSSEYYFVVSAYNIFRYESDYSNEVRVGSNTITASAGAHGRISPQGVVSVFTGSSQSFTITPDTYYHVSDVVIDGVSVGAVTDYTFLNIANDHTIFASFAIDTHTITASAGANGSIFPRGAISVDSGSSRSFTITPGVNYRVNDVVVDGISVGAVTSYTFDNTTNDHTISASFATDSVSATNSGGGGGCLISVAAEPSL